MPQFEILFNTDQSMSNVSRVLERIGVVVAIKSTGKAPKLVAPVHKVPSPDVVTVVKVDPRTLTDDNRRSMKARKDEAVEEVPEAIVHPPVSDASRLHTPEMVEKTQQARMQLRDVKRAAVKDVIRCALRKGIFSTEKLVKHIEELGLKQFNGANWTMTTVEPLQNEVMEELTTPSKESDQPLVNGHAAD